MDSAFRLQYATTDEAVTPVSSDKLLPEYPHRHREADRRCGPALFPHMTIAVRDAAGIAAECRAIRGDEDLRLYLVDAGELIVATDAPPCRVVARQILVLDLRRPFELKATGGRIVTATVASDMLARPISAERGFHGLVLDNARCALLGDVLLSLARSGTPASPPLASLATTTVLAFLGAALDAEGDGRVCAVAPGDRAKRERATAYIDAALHRHDLSVDTIARDVGMSRSALYRVFESYGGVARHIGQRRLLALRRAMSGAGETRPFSALALDHGFASVSHASRCFKDRFGITPGQFRRVQMAGFAIGG